LEVSHRKTFPGGFKPQSPIYGVIEKNVPVFLAAGFQKCFILKNRRLYLMTPPEHTGKIPTNIQRRYLLPVALYL
jgi:hypothetical protein